MAKTRIERTRVAAREDFSYADLVALTSWTIA
jgi:hypothetical protein